MEEDTLLEDSPVEEDNPFLGGGRSGGGGHFGGGHPSREHSCGGHSGGVKTSLTEVVPVEVFRGEVRDPGYLLTAPSPHNCHS